MRKIKLLLKVFSLLHLATFTAVGQIYNEQNVQIQNVLSYYEGLVPLTVTEYSTDPGNVNKRKMLQVMEDNSPAQPYSIVTMARYTKNGQVVTVPFEDHDNDGYFDDNLDGLSSTYTIQQISQMAVNAHYSAKVIGDFFKNKFNHTNFNSGFPSDQIKIILLLEENLGPCTSNACFSNHEVYLRVISPGLNASVSLDIIAHEIIHGIVEYWNKVPQSPQSSEIVEGLADFFAASVALDHNLSWGSPYWNMGSQIYSNPAWSMRCISNPKSTLNPVNPIPFPDTHLGQHYDFLYNNPYQNSTVISHFFYILSKGKTGLNDLGSNYAVSPIGVEDATKIAFHTMKYAFSSIDNFNNFMQDVWVSATNLFNNDPFIDDQVRRAWHAVGVGWPEDFMLQPVDVNVTAQSYYDGPVEIKVRAFPNWITQTTAYKLFQGPGTLPSHYVEHHFNNQNISLLTKYLDPDGNLVFGPFNNLEKSKKAVSAYWGMQQTLSYLSQLGVALPPSNSGLSYSFDIDMQQYSGLAPPLTLDLTAGSIAEIVYMLSNDAPVSQEETSIMLALNDIVGVLVKNNYRQSHGLAPVWTIGEQLYNGSDYLRSLEDPASKGYQAYYNGPGYDPTATVANSGIMDKWFYLIFNGGIGTTPNGDDVAIIPIGDGLARDLALRLLNGHNLTDFYSVREASLNVMESFGYFLGDALYNSVLNAWAGVGVGDSYGDMTVWHPYDGALEVEMPNWLATIGWAVDYTGVEGAWEIEVSTKIDDPAQTKSLFSSKLGVDPSTNSTITWANASFDGEQTIYWRKRATEILTCPEEGAPKNGNWSTKCDGVMQVWSRWRSFKTESKQVQFFSPTDGTTDHYPWGSEFELGNELDGAESIKIQIGEDEQFAILSPYLDAEFSASGAAVETYKTDLKIDFDYFAHAKLIGPFHSIYSQRNTEGIWSDTIMLKTSIPKTKCQSPEDGSEAPFYGIELERGGTWASTAYLWEVSNTSDFADQIALPESSTAENTIVSELAYFGQVSEGNIYFWRVRPIGPSLPQEANVPDPYQGNKEIGESETPFSFVVKEPIPMLHLPADGDEEEYLQDIDFVWHPLEAIVNSSSGYVLRIYKNDVEVAAMSVPANPQPVGSELFELQTVSGVSDDPAADWSWEVMTIPPPVEPGWEPFKETTSERWHYTIGPDDVQLIAPADGASNVSLTTTLEWFNEYHPNGYGLEIEKSSIQLSGNNVFSVGDVQQYTTTKLEPNTEYHWRAGVFLDDGDINWSNDIFSFTTECPLGEMVYELYNTSNLVLEDWIEDPCYGNDPIIWLDEETGQPAGVEVFPTNQPNGPSLYGGNLVQWPKGTSTGYFVVLNAVGPWAAGQFITVIVNGVTVLNYQVLPDDYQAGKIIGHYQFTVN